MTRVEISNFIIIKRKDLKPQDELLPVEKRRELDPIEQTEEAMKLIRKFRKRKVRKGAWSTAGKWKDGYADY